MRVGCLALQGDFAEHVAVLRRIGVEGFEVRSAADLERTDALIIPGGESTTIIKLIDRFELRDDLVKRIHDDLPVFGTCAGAIVLASNVSDGEPPLGLLDVDVIRNAYGRQRESFETDVEVDGIDGEPVRAVFIRAPVIQRVGEGVDVLGTWADRPVVVRSGNILASTFHPEMTDDDRVHRFFVEEIAG